MPAFDSASPTPGSSQFGVSSGHEHDPLFAGSADAPPPDRHFGRVGQVPWTLSQTIVGTAVTLVPWVTVLVATQLTASPSVANAKPLARNVDIASGIVFFIFTAVVESAFLVAPLYIAVVRRPPGMTRREGLYALGLRPTPLIAALGWVVVGLAMILAATLLYQWVIQLLHLPLQTNADALAKRAKLEPFTVLGALAGAVLVAPICEEIFFRGFAFAGFLRGMSVWPAVTLSALLFGISHGDIGSLAPLIVFGAVVAIVRWRTGSIWPGVVIHATNNLIAALAIVAVLTQ